MIDIAGIRLVRSFARLRRFASVKPIPRPPDPPAPKPDPQVLEFDGFTIYIFPEPDGRVIIDYSEGPIDEITLHPDGTVSVLDGTGERRTDYPEPDKRTVIDYPEPFKRTVTHWPDGSTTVEPDDPADGPTRTYSPDGSVTTFLSGGSVTMHPDGTGRYDPIPCDTVVSEVTNPQTGVLTQTYASGIKVITTPGVGSHVVVPDKLNDVPCPEHDNPPDPDDVA